MMIVIYQFMNNTVISNCYFLKTAPILATKDFALQCIGPYAFWRVSSRVKKLFGRISPGVVFYQVRNRVFFPRLNMILSFI